MTEHPLPYTVLQAAGLCAGPLLFLLILFTGIGTMSWQAKVVAAGTVWIIVWWITEPVPIAATSLLPIILFPVSGAMDAGAVTAEYGNQIIFLFIGGFLIAIAMEKWNLHTRIALLIIGLIGTSPRRIIAGFLVATAFISAWISNSATAMMMLPVALAVTLKMRGDAYESTFRIALILAVAYGASIGGIATLIGSPPNMILAGMSRTITGSEITFLTWASFGVPIACILLVLCWFYLVYIAFPQKPEHAVISIEEEIRSLGPVSVEERRVLAVFLLVASLWISRTLWGTYLPMVTDSVIAVFGAVTLFLVPAREHKRLLCWEDALHLPWNIVLLFGCGFAIAQGFVETGLGAWTADQLHFLAGVPPLIVLLALIILVLFVTEITSNTATATIFIPITAVLASVSGIEPLFLMIPAAIASSLAFMLPVSTPPNAIVYGTGYVTMSQMIRAGFWMNCISIIVLMIAIPLFVK